MGRSAGNHLGNLMEFHTVCRVVTLMIISTLGDQFVITWLKYDQNPRFFDNDNEKHTSCWATFRGHGEHNVGRSDWLPYVCTSITRLFKNSFQLNFLVSFKIHTMSCCHNFIASCLTITSVPPSIWGVLFCWTPCIHTIVTGWKLVGWQHRELRGLGSDCGRCGTSGSVSVAMQHKAAPTSWVDLSMLGFRCSDSRRSCSD